MVDSVSLYERRRFQELSRRDALKSTLEQTQLLQIARDHCDCPKDRGGQRLIGSCVYHTMLAEHGSQLAFDRHIASKLEAQEFRR